MQIGTMDLVVILIAAFLVLGPERTGIYAKKLGKCLRVFKVYIKSLSDELEESVIPINELRQPLDELAKPVTEISDAIKAPLRELNCSVQSSASVLNKSLEPAADQK